MHRQLLTLRARSKKGNARQRIGCKFRLPANRPWQHMKFPSLLPDLASANHAKWTEGKDLRFHERALPHPRPEQFFLTCPRPSCGATKDCARCLLHFKTAFKPVKCSSCNSSPSSAKWCCPCGHLWHHCPLHRAPGFAAGSGKRSTRAGVRRGAPKALGHTHDVRDGIALRAAIAAADLQASWDSTSLSGPAAAFATAHGLGGHSIDGSQPPHCPPKRAKILKVLTRALAPRLSVARPCLQCSILAALCCMFTPLFPLRWPPPPVLFLPMMMRAVFPFGQAGCLEPPKGSSLVANLLVTLLGDAASHLCHQARARPQRQPLACF